jgi:hypothetical protein
MIGFKLGKYTKRIQNILLAALFSATQVVVPLTYSRIVQAASIPTNKVGFSSLGFVLSGSYSSVAGQPTGTGQLKNGNVGGYPEGACIPAEFKVTNNSNTAGDTIISPIFDYKNNGIIGISNYEKVTTSLSGDPSATADNLNDFSFSGQPLSSATSFPLSTGGTISANVTGPFSNNDAGTSATTANDAFRHYNISLPNIPSGASVYIMLCGRLGLDASEYPGASLSLRTVQGGAENVPIPVNQILVLPSITINKTVQQGSAVASDFSFNVSPSVNGQSTYTIPSGQSSVTVNNVNPDGSYTITESGPSGYVFTGGTGTSCTVVAATLNTASGQMTASVAAGKPPTNATCSFTNTQNTGTITLIKSVTNDNGGTAGVNAFGLSIGGTSVTSSQTLTLNPGSYAINEAGLTGYSFVSITGTGCPTTLGGNVTLASNQNITCTITNDDIAPQLTVIKNVTNDNGGNAVAGDFTMSVIATDVSDDSFPGVSGSGTTVTLDAGSYSVSEGGPSGYSGSYSTDCSGTIAIGETKTCTVTNNDDAPRLTLIKSVTNNSGGALLASDFALHLSGGAYNGTQNFSSSSTPTVASNTAYTVSESTVTGYAQTGIVCVDDNTQAIVSQPVSLNEGQQVTCTISNDDIAPLLTVTKIVTNNSGGTLQVSDFPLYVNALQVTSGTQNSFTAGNYTVSETNQTGYVAGTWSGDCNPDGTITLQIGSTYSCTITNNDAPATIKVTKQVIKDNGGTATVSDFTLKVNTTEVASGVTNNFDGNTSYTISEIANVSGYTQTSLTCLDVTNGGSTSVGATFTAQLGHAYECTIVNDDIAPTLTLVKNVVNDNNGSATIANFQAKIDGNNVSWSQAVTLNTGSYTASEAVLAGGEGYTASSWTGDCAADGSITLTEGQNKTCTITNDDQQAKIVLVKNLPNDDGGTAVQSDFTVTLSGNAAAWGDNTVNAGSYTASETTLPGYAPSVWGGDCDANGNVTVTPGQTKTCSITNDDIAPTLTLKKIVVNDNGGDNDADEWTLTAQEDGQSALINTTGTPNGDGTQATTSAATAEAGIDYDLSESGPSGYTASAWSCDGGTLQNGSITLDLDEDVTCTITNDDEQGTITVIKDIDTTAVADGVADTSDVSDWKWNIDDSGNYDTGSSNPQSVDAGTYIVSEVQKQNYEVEDVECTSDSESELEQIIEQLLLANASESAEVTVDSGENITCRFLNHQVPVVLNLSKSVDKPAPQGNLVGDTLTYTLTVSVPEDSGTSFNTIVTDLPPSNFTVVNQTAWTVHSNVRGDFTVPNPNYGSPGSWELGDMVPGEVVTITYQVIVGSSVTPGDYPDIAFAQSCDLPLVEDSCSGDGSTVLSNLSTEETPFVGTEVRVVAAAPTGHVLGASILVNTGQQNLWYSFLAGGGLLVAALLTLRRKKGAQK